MTENSWHTLGVEQKQSPVDDDDDDYHDSDEFCVPAYDYNRSLTISHFPFQFNSDNLPLFYLSLGVIISQVHAREAQSIECPFVGWLSASSSQILDQSKRRRESGLDYGLTLTDWLLIL